MSWGESDDDKVNDCITKLEDKARILEEELAKINTLRKIAGKIKTRTILVEKEPNEKGMRQTETQIIKPKDDFGVELKDNYRLDQLSKLVTKTNIELGDKN